MVAFFRTSMVPRNHRSPIKSRSESSIRMRRCNPWIPLHTYLETDLCPTSWNDIQRCTATSRLCFVSIPRTFHPSSSSNRSPLLRHLFDSKIEVSQMKNVARGMTNSTSFRIDISSSAKIETNPKEKKLIDSSIFSTGGRGIRWKRIDVFGGDLDTILRDSCQAGSHKERDVGERWLRRARFDVEAHLWRFSCTFLASKRDSLDPQAIYDRP